MSELKKVQLKKEHFSNEQMALVEKRKNDLKDIHDDKTILDYGSDTQAKLASTSGQLLKSFENTDENETTTHIKHLLGEVDNVAEDLDEGKIVKFLRKSKLGNYIVKQAKSKMNDFHNAEENINKISTKIKQSSVGIQNDNQHLNEISEANKDLMRNMKIDIYALQERLQDAQDEYKNLQIERKKAEDEGDDLRVDEIDIEINSLNMSIERLDRKIFDLSKTLMNSIQNLYIINSMKKTNIVLLEKYKNIQNDILPKWKTRVLISLFSKSQKKRSDLERMINETNNQMHYDNAKSVTDTMLQVAESNQKDSESMESIEKVNQIFKDSLLKLKEIEQKGVENRMQNMQKLEETYNDFKNTMSSDTNLSLENKTSNKSLNK